MNKTYKLTDLTDKEVEELRSCEDIKFVLTEHHPIHQSGQTDDFGNEISPIQYNYNVIVEIIPSTKERESKVETYISSLTLPGKNHRIDHFSREYSYLKDFKEIFGITKPSELILPLTILFCVAAIIAGSIRLSLLWFGIRLSNATGADLGMEVYRRALFQPYPIHISRSSSEIISGITQKVGATTKILLSLVTVVTSSFLLIAILATLIFINPLIALASLATFGIAYFLLAMSSKKRLDINSNEIATAQTNVVRSLQEGLGAIRDVLLGGMQNIYAGHYRTAIDQLRFAHGGNSFINQAPRFGM